MPGTLLAPFPEAQRKRERRSFGELLDGHPLAMDRSIGSTDSLEVLVRLEAEAAGDDFFLDLGGAAENHNS